MITCHIEPISYNELLTYMRQQAEDAFPSLKDEERLQAFAAKLHQNAEFCLCRDNGELVGMIAFYANGQGADFAYIPHVFVSLDYRKTGLFSRMLKVIEEYVQERGFSEIKLEVADDNTTAQSAYQKQGFLREGAASTQSSYMKKIIK